jgi:PadR family transcriptional regulator, regulatory protein AphA
MRSQTLAPQDYVVLGMVGLGRRSGYEIKQAVDLSIRFFWTISPAQIYPSLAKLERASLLSGRDEPQGRRRRRLYELTDDGHVTLQEWLRSAEPLPFELRDIGMVKLFFADTLTQSEAAGLLTTIRDRSEQRLRELRAIRPAAETAERQGTVYPPLTLELGIAYHQAMVDVCERFGHRPAPEA